MAGKKLGRAKPTMRAGTKVPGDDEINTPRIVMGVAKGKPKRNRTKDKDNPSDTKKFGAPAKRDIEKPNRIRQAMRDIQNMPYKFSRTAPQQFTGIEQFKKDQHQKAKSEGFILTGENTKIYFGDKELKAIADLPKPDMHDICAICNHEYAMHTSHEDRPSVACVNVTRIPGRRSVIKCLCKGFVRTFQEARCAVCTHTYSSHNIAGVQSYCTTRIPIPTGQTVCTCSAFVHQMPEETQAPASVPDPSETCVFCNHTFARHNKVNNRGGKCKVPVCTCKEFHRAALYQITLTGCEVQYDTRRGVLYVHGPHGGTVVRICRIPHVVDIGKYGNTLDVTMGHNARETGPEVRIISKRLTIRQWNQLVAARKIKDLSEHLPAEFLMIGQTMRALIEYEGQIWLATGWQTSEEASSAFVELNLTHEYDAAIEKVAAQKKEREQFRSDANKTRLGD